MFHLGFDDLELEVGAHRWPTGLLLGQKSLLYWEYARTAIKDHIPAGLKYWLPLIDQSFSFVLIAALS